MTIPMEATIFCSKRLLPPYKILINNFADRPAPRTWRYDRIIGEFSDEQCQLSPDSDSKASVRFRPIRSIRRTRWLDGATLRKILSARIFLSACGRVSNRGAFRFVNGGDLPCDCAVWVSDTRVPAIIAWIRPDRRVAKAARGIATR